MKPKLKNRFVAFLRGINLGKRRLHMSQLKALFEALEFDEVATFIASGNVVFSSPERDATKLEDRIAKHLHASLGYGVDTFVRTTEEVACIGQMQAFPEAGQPGMTIHVGFFQQPLDRAVARSFMTVRTADDEFRVRDREYFWLCRVRINESQVWSLPEIKALRLPTSTMRNMTSIRKLIAKHIA